eukprot:scaffold25328_cov18-Prasinocladus_malaysianus.AAC.1
MRVSRELRHAKQSATRRSLLPSYKQQPAKPKGECVSHTMHTHRKGAAGRLLATPVHLLMSMHLSTYA